MALTKISGEVIQSNIDISSTGIITATTFSGALSGNVTGSVTGNVTGDLTGNVTGNVTGNINSSGVSTVTTLNATTISGVSTIGVTTATVTTLTVNGNNYPSAGPLSNRNLIINGAMQVAQRSTSETSQTTGGYKTCDRYLFDIQNLGTWTIAQATDSPAGFSNSLKATCTTADASPAAGDYILVSQRIEAQNLQHLAYGNSSAKQLTLSFWVKSNKTGSASFELIQIDNSNKLFSNSYTISAADTWEQKTISIPADTSGVINNDNGTGFQLAWWLNSGSTFTGGSFQTAWATLTNANRNVSNLGVGGATSDYFAITGVQLEVGETATPFEHRSYGEELALCQRYYEQFEYNTTYQEVHNPVRNGSTNSQQFTKYFTQKRSTPNISTSAVGTFRLNDGSHDQICNGITINFITDRQAGFSFTKATADLTQNGAGYVNTEFNNDAYIYISAEL